MSGGLSTSPNAHLEFPMQIYSHFQGLISHLPANQRIKHLCKIVMVNGVVTTTKSLFHSVACYWTNSNHIHTLVRVEPFNKRRQTISIFQKKHFVSFFMDFLGICLIFMCFNIKRTNLWWFWIAFNIYWLHLSAYFNFSENNSPPSSPFLCILLVHICGVIIVYLPFVQVKR